MTRSLQDALSLALSPDWSVSRLPVMATSERVAAFLGHANIVDALREDVEAEANGDAMNVVVLLSDVASLSEQYIPTLQFLMRPDNRTFFLHRHFAPFLLS